MTLHPGKTSPTHGLGRLRIKIEQLLPLHRLRRGGGGVIQLVGRGGGYNGGSLSQRIGGGPGGE